MQQLEDKLCKRPESPLIVSIPMKKLLAISSALLMLIFSAQGQQSSKLNFSLQKKLSEARQSAQ